MVFPLLAIGLLVMMYPILCKVQYETLHRVTQDRELWIQLGFSIVLNWLIAPFLMVCSQSCDSKEMLTETCSSLSHGRFYLMSKAFEKA